MRNVDEESRIHSGEGNEGGREMITTNEADFYAQHSEWVALNAEYEARFQQWRTKPGHFRSWWKFGAFCIFTGLMWGFLVWGGKALLEIVRR